MSDGSESPGSASGGSGGGEELPLVAFGGPGGSYTDEPAGGTAATGAPRMKRARKRAGRERMARRPNRHRNMSVTAGAGALLFAAAVLMAVYLHGGGAGAGDGDGSPGSPARLPAGARPRSEARLVSPAGPLREVLRGDGGAALLDLARERLAPLGLAGLEPSLGAHALGSRRGYLAGDDAGRAADLGDALRAPNVSMVLVTAGGGSGSLAAVEELRGGAPLRPPGGAPRAVVLGSGDATALLNALVTLEGTAAFHGPLVADAAGWSNVTTRWLRLVAVDGAAALLENDPAVPPPVTVRGGTARGVAVGGSLRAVASLAGTPYLPAPAAMRGHTLFLEAAGEAAESVDRYLTQLAASGYLGAAAAVVFGSCAGCGAGWEEAVDERLGALGVPAFRGAMFGGGLVHQYVLPLGVPVMVDAGAGTVQMLQSALRPRDA